MKYRPQNRYGWTAVAWLAGMGAHLVWSVLQQRALPSTDEVYSQFLSFQLASFAFTAFPYWLVALLVALLIEFLIFGRKAR